MPRHFYTLDVFTDRALAGNPLAVVLDAQGLTDVAMQAIAREFNLAETVFVLPPQDPHQRAKLRIFTPARELPFAGHPTVGAGRKDDAQPFHLTFPIGIGRTGFQTPTETTKIEEKLAGELKYPIVEKIIYPAKSTQLTSEVQRIKAANPDLIMQSSYLGDAILSMKTYKELGVSPDALLANDAGAALQQVAALGVLEVRAHALAFAGDQRRHEGERERDQHPRLDRFARGGFGRVSLAIELFDALTDLGHQRLEAVLLADGIDLGLDLLGRQLHRVQPRRRQQSSDPRHAGIGRKRAVALQPRIEQ